MPGWETDKFVVRHHRRGDLLDGESFVLVPDRDPAAWPALRAYAAATSDIELAEYLLELVGEFDGQGERVVVADDRIPGWIATLSDEVQAGRMSIATALSRIASLVKGEATCSVPDVGARPES